MSNNISIRLYSDNSNDNNYIKKIEEFKMELFENEIIEDCSFLDKFKWDILDLSVSEIRKEMTEFLENYYVEDKDHTFRLSYSEELLEWAILIPNYYKEWHIGIRVKSNNKLVACIIGTPIDIEIYDKTIKSSEISQRLRQPEIFYVYIQKLEIID